MKLSGWGQYPVVDSEVLIPLNSQETLRYIDPKYKKLTIARGLGRSYGDSSLSERVIDITYLKHFLEFNKHTGVITCSAGVFLSDILSLFVPKAWFLPVSPGTKFVTVGGAIASDVHGKNHNIEGSFSDYVIKFKIATVSDGIIECSREHHSELFYASCGGMGLTGIILEATFKLKPIQSAYIKQTTIKANNLKEAFDLFDVYKSCNYSIAWIDCLSTGKSLGRSIIMLGDHEKNGCLSKGKRRNLSIPFNFPSFFLNRYSNIAFNTLYFHFFKKTLTQSLSHYESFFYPLDGINNWNRMYGKNGFIQYQFVLPKEAAYTGISYILKKIVSLKRGSFLAILKAFGKENKNYLSFPKEGYTLALDFKINKDLFEFIRELDNIVLEFGGRLYLSKDACMSENMFKKSYNKWDKFYEVRLRYGANKVFNSLQSNRLGL